MHTHTIYWNGFRLNDSHYLFCGKWLTGTLSCDCHGAGGFPNDPDLVIICFYSSVTHLYTSQGSTTLHQEDNMEGTK